VLGAARTVCAGWVGRVVWSVGPIGVPLPRRARRAGRSPGRPRSRTRTGTEAPHGDLRARRGGDADRSDRPDHPPRPPRTHGARLAQTHTPHHRPLIHPCHVAGSAPNVILSSMPTTLIDLDVDILVHLLDRLLTNNFTTSPSIVDIRLVSKLARVCHSTYDALKAHDGLSKGVFVSTPLPSFSCRTILDDEAMNGPFPCFDYYYSPNNNRVPVSYFKLSGGIQLEVGGPDSSLGVLQTIVGGRRFLSSGWKETILFRRAAMLHRNITSYGTTYMRQGAMEPRAVVWCSFKEGASIATLSGIKSEASGGTQLADDEDALVGFECDLSEIAHPDRIRSRLYKILICRVAGTNIF